MPNEFIIKNGFRSQGNSEITGSLSTFATASTATLLTLGASGSTSTTLTYTNRVPTLALTSNTNGPSSGGTGPDYLLTLNKVGSDGGPKVGIQISNAGVNSAILAYRAGAPSYLDMGFLIANNQILTLTSAQTVGIGTISPSSKLHVLGSGTTSATTALLVQNANASASLSVLDNGFVGINTGSAQYNLDVNGSLRASSINVPAVGESTTSANITSTGTGTGFGFFSATVHFTEGSNKIFGGGNAYNNLGFVVGANAFLGWRRSGNILNGIQNTETRLYSDANNTIDQRNSANSQSFRIYNTYTDASNYERNTQAWSGSVFNIVNEAAGTGIVRSINIQNTLNISGSNVGIGISGSLSKLAVYKSGSTVLDIQGSQGQLFSVVDALSGSLMSVNDVSGLPILEVFSDDRVVMGTYGAPALIVTGSNTVISGSLDVSGSARITNSLTVTGSLLVTGSQVITGSLRGNVSALTIASTTASVDISSGNFFTLNLVNGANTHINPTNINPGQTINIRVTQGSAGTGTVTFPSLVKQASGSLYTGSAVANAIDIVTMISFDSTTVFISSVRNMI